MDVDEKRIVFLEDEDTIRENYTEFFMLEGYRVDAYKNTENVLLAIKHSPPDIVLLDIAIGADQQAGFHLCEQIRQFSTTIPIAFLTSHCTDKEKIEGFALGADDYLVKDCSLGLLSARINSIIVRSKMLQQNDTSVFKSGHIVRGKLLLDLQNQLAYWDQQEVKLSLTQFLILQELAARPGEIKTPSQLMAAANIVVEPNTITAQIRTIRASIKNIDKQFASLVSEYGRGYRWLVAQDKAGEE